MCQWPVMRQRCPGSLRRGACESCEFFCSVQSAQSPSRYGMSGNEAETTNPLCQVLRALFSTSQGRKRELEAQPPQARSLFLRPAQGPRVYEKAAGGHLACADRSPSRHQPYTSSLSKASSCPCLDGSFEGICSFETALSCLCVLVVGCVSYRYCFGVT